VAESTLPLDYLDKQRLGDLVARVSSDSEQLTNGLLMIFNQFILGMLTIFFMIFTMADLDLLMMIVVVALTPFSLFVAHFIAKKSYFYYRKQTQARGEQVSMLEESVGQLPLIQVFSHFCFIYGQSYNTLYQCLDLFFSGGTRSLANYAGRLYGGWFNHLS
jgi:ATP-binding cassette subfamily B protein